MTNQIITQLNPDVPPTGSDLGIVNAARKSFGRRSDWEYTSLPKADIDFHPSDRVRSLKDKDKRLLEFLARGMTAQDFTTLRMFVESSVLGFQEGAPECQEDLIKTLWQWRNTPTHDTPFNHGFFSFEVKAPIFVARHLVKHEYLIMSEYSRRYITDDVEFYTPDVWRGKAEDVKQGSGGAATSQYFPASYCEQTGIEALQRYNKMLEQGICAEQARIILPQNLMTAWTWSGTLGAFANMCKLRLAKDTQYETRLVAQGVYEELKKQFPVAAPLLVEGAL
jgi:thymidylate synthase (FAD)|tara:strand:+ start:3534 stop:4373 length:840 start_codon:yes stop_codon:yes gene_type:complete